MSNRNSSLELLRCLLMFGVVVEHTAGQCAYIEPMVVRFSNWCVCGFVFLSGWFGVRFSWWKVCKLVALGVWCAMVSLMIGGERNPIYAMLGVRAYWFLWAYIIMMIFAPVIDAAIESCNRQRMMRLIVPVLVMLWGWGIACGIPVVRDYVPHTPGLGGLSSLSLIVIYFAVRVYRQLDLSRFLASRLALWLLPLCLGFLSVGFYGFWWVPSFVLTAIVFERFRVMTLPEWLSKVAIFVAPSAFSVYLLHMLYGGGIKWMTRFEIWCHETQGIAIPLTFLITAVTTYMAALYVDLLRRLLVSGGVRILRRMSNERA